MKQIIWLMVAALLIFHHDFWNWNDETVFFGFMPIGLFYHACLSLAAALVWSLACLFAWPKGLDEHDDQPAGNGGDA